MIGGKSTVYLYEAEEKRGKREGELVSEIMGGKYIRNSLSSCDSHFHFPSLHLHTHTHTHEFIIATASMDLAQ